MRKMMMMVACLFAMLACKKNEDNTTPKLSVSTTTISFAADEATPRQLTVNAENTDWSFNVSESWVSADRDDNKLIVSVSANESADAREAVITISATVSGVEPVAVKVKQAGLEVSSGGDAELSASVTSLKFEATNAAAQSVTITSNGLDWDVKNEYEWVKVSKNDNVVSISVDDNDMSKERNSFVMIYCPTDVDVIPVRINISQEACYADPAIYITNMPEDYHVVYQYYQDGSFRTNIPDPSSDIFVRIEPQTATCSIEFVSGDDWLDAVCDGADGNQLLFYILDGKAKDIDQDAEFIVRHNEDPSVFVTVTVHKTPFIRVDSSSTLSSDVENQDLPQVFGRITTFGASMNMDYSQIMLAFYSDGVNYDHVGQIESGITYKYDGQGEIVFMTLYDDPKVSDLTPRTYTIGETEEVGNIAEGSSRYSLGRIQLAGTYYARIDNNIAEDVEFAVMTSGSVTVSKTDGQYSIEWNFYSDNGYEVSGSYNGEIEFETRHTGFDGVDRGETPDVMI